MKIENLKDLQKLMSLCRRMGVEAFEVDGIKFNLGPQPKKQAKVQPEMDFPEANIRVPTPNLLSPKVQAAVDETIRTDELSEEALLFYSTRTEDAEAN